MLPLPSPKRHRRPICNRCGENGARAEYIPIGSGRHACRRCLDAMKLRLPLAPTRPRHE